MGTDNYVSVWAMAKETARGFVVVGMPIKEAIELSRVDVLHYDEYTNEWVAIDRNWHEFTDWRMLLQVPGAFLIQSARKG